MAGLKKARRAAAKKAGAAKTGQQIPLPPLYQPPLVPKPEAVYGGLDLASKDQVDQLVMTTGDMDKP